MKRPTPPSFLQAHNERAALGEMPLKVGPIPFERVGTKAGFLEVSLHGACEDSMRVSGIKGILNGGRVCSSGERGVALFVPILNDHRNRGGPAPSPLLA